jgi:hypothetical protein
MQELVVSFLGELQVVFSRIIQTLIKLKPTAAKVIISKYLPLSTMGPAIALNPKAV